MNECQTLAVHVMERLIAACCNSKQGFPVGARILIYYSVAKVNSLFKKKLYIYIKRSIYMFSKHVERCLASPISLVHSI